VSDVEIEVARALAVPEVNRLKATFFRLNPGWRGAEVADILANLNSVDSNLGIVESLYAAHGSHVTEPGLLGTAVRAVVWMWAGRIDDAEMLWADDADAIWDYASDIIRRVRVARGEQVNNR
jgi:hypothetical protein